MTLVWVGSKENEVDTGYEWMQGQFKNLSVESGLSSEFVEFDIADPERFDQAGPSNNDSFFLEEDSFNEFNATSLLDNQVLSECIRNLELGPIKKTSSVEEGPLKGNLNSELKRLVFGIGKEGCGVEKGPEANVEESKSFCQNCCQNLAVGSKTNYPHIHRNPSPASPHPTRLTPHKTVINPISSQQQATTFFNQEANCTSKSTSPLSATQASLSRLTSLSKLYSYCTFCKNNGESEAIYGTHSLKDSNGTVICPILRAYTCPICGENGDNAHTVKYCPTAARLAPKDSPVRSEMRVLRTARTSAGRRRFY
jgi:protein nanos 1